MVDYCVDELSGERFTNSGMNLLALELLCIDFISDGNYCRTFPYAAVSFLWQQYAEARLARENKQEYNKRALQIPERLQRVCEASYPLKLWLDDDRFQDTAREYRVKYSTEILELLEQEKKEKKERDREILPSGTLSQQAALVQLFQDANVNRLYLDSNNGNEYGECCFRLINAIISKMPDDHQGNARAFCTTWINENIGFNEELVAELIVRWWDKLINKLNKILEERQQLHQLMHDDTSDEYQVLSVYVLTGGPLGNKEAAINLVAIGLDQRWVERTTACGVNLPFKQANSSESAAPAPASVIKKGPHALAFRPEGIPRQKTLTEIIDGVTKLYIDGVCEKSNIFHGKKGITTASALRESVGLKRYEGSAEAASERANIVAEEEDVAGIGGGQPSAAAGAVDDHEVVPESAAAHEDERVVIDDQTKQALCSYFQRRQHSWGKRFFKEESSIRSPWSLDVMLLRALNQPDAIVVRDALFNQDEEGRRHLHGGYLTSKADLGKLYSYMPTDRRRARAYLAKQCKPE